MKNPRDRLFADALFRAFTMLGIAGNRQFMEKLYRALMHLAKNIKRIYLDDDPTLDDPALATGNSLEM